MSDPNEITARDRIAAFKLAREADDLSDEMAVRHPWVGWILRPLAKFLRWAATEEDHHDGWY